MTQAIVIGGLSGFAFDSCWLGLIKRTTDHLQIRLPSWCNSAKLYTVPKRPILALSFGGRVACFWVCDGVNGAFGRSFKILLVHGNSRSRDDNWKRYAPSRKSLEELVIVLFMACPTIGGCHFSPINIQPGGAVSDQKTKNLSSFSGTGCHCSSMSIGLVMKWYLMDVGWLKAKSQEIVRIWRCARCSMIWNVRSTKICQKIGIFCRTGRVRQFLSS